MSDLYDICESRHRGNACSAAAFGSIAPVLCRKQSIVLDVIRSKGLDGCTAKEIAASLGSGLHQISGRCSELKRMGLVIDSNRRREGSAVLVAKEFVL